MRHSIMLAGFAAIAATALSLLTPGASPAASIGCGTVVTTDTTLTADITGCPGDGIVIGANGITLDLNGHTLSGTGGGDGVDSYLFTGIHVLNGTIEGFSTGILVECNPLPQHCIPNGPSLSDRLNVFQSLHVQRDGNGIVEHGPTSTLISNNLIHDNTGSAVYLHDDVSGDVLNNEIFHNGGPAIDRYYDSDGVVANNNVHDNGGGIYAELAPNTIIDNTVRRVSGPGIRTDDVSDGFYPYYRIANNTTDSNGGYGIEVQGDEGDATVEDAGGNAADNNALTPECVVHMLYPNALTAFPCAQNRGQAKQRPVVEAPLHTTARP